MAPRDIAADAIDSVATIRCGRQSGSGFFISEHRLLTNEHVTCGPEVPIEVQTTKGKKANARVVSSSKRLDAALLEVSDVTGKPLTLASAGALVAGDPVMVIGNPVGMESTFHVGTISNPHRVLLDVCYLQLDARINPGNSGGPALDGQGRVIGIVSLKRKDAEGIGMALPIDYLFEGPDALVDAPASHPTPGFTAMLKLVEESMRQLREEREAVGVRLVNAQVITRTRAAAIVMTMAEATPSADIQFKLEGPDSYSCEIRTTADWKASTPEAAFALRARDFLAQEGLGQVYVGSSEIDFLPCPDPPVGDIYVAVVGARDPENRIRLMNWRGRR